MRYLHTMVRVQNLERSLDFYCNKLGLVETRRYDNEKGKFTLVFLAAPEDLEQAKTKMTPVLELTYNWETEEYSKGRNFGHLAYSVTNIYDACQNLMDSISQMSKISSFRIFFCLPVISQLQNRSHFCFSLF